MKYRLGILSTHPIQYFSPWYRALASHPEIDLQVFYAHRQTPRGQAEAGFGVSFEWDMPLLEGYRHQFLKNVARRPGTDHFLGCDTPEIGDIINRQPFDAFIVSGWYVKSYWQAIQACRRRNIPLLVRGDSQLPTPRPWFSRWAGGMMHRYLIPRFDGYLVVGQRAREYFLHYGAKAKRMFPVPHAVDNAFFDRSAKTFRLERQTRRKAWGLPAEAVVFLFVGKLLARKRPLDFLEAVQRAVSSRGMPVAGLVVGEGPLRPAMEQFVQERNLPVHFTGFLNQSVLPEAYSVSDALVLPSDGSETWGLVVNEAMASGLPALVSDQVGCGPDLVIPHQTGEIFPCGDFHLLGRLLQELAEDPARLRQMGDLARRKIEEYSIDRAVEGTLAAVRVLHGEGRKEPLE